MICDLQVRNWMDVESARRPDEVGSSVRRNPFQLSPSSFHKILKKKLMLVPFRYVCLKTLVIHHHSIQAPQTSEAKAPTLPQEEDSFAISLQKVIIICHFHSWVNTFCHRPRQWFNNLLVSDECWLTLGGHVFNR